jgi:pyruvate,water dikinase
VLAAFSRIVALIRGWSYRLGLGAVKHDPSELAAARDDLQARYQALRLLLSANTRALGQMAEMECAASGSSPFDMAFVRARCTAVVVNVYQMVRQLNAMSDGRYPSLFDRIDGIREHLRSVLAGAQPDADTPIVLPLSEVDGAVAEAVGAKMGHLGEIRNVLKLRVPEGFVVTARAQELFFRAGDLRPEIDRLTLAGAPEGPDEVYALASRIQQVIMASELPAEIRSAVEGAYDELARALGRSPALAVRSSALDEDAAGSSFAGQYHSVLNVRREGLLDAYREVVAGMYSAQAMEYRLRRGLRDDRNRMCVGFLVMIDAQAGGVAYTSHPSEPADRNVYINAAIGLPVAVVDGRTPTDTIVVSRAEPRTILEQTNAHKTWQFICDAEEGVARVEVPDERKDAPSLDTRDALEVAEQALRLEAHFGAPQDVEWAFDRDGALVVLQSRPLQQVARVESRPERRKTGPPLLSGGLCASPGSASGPVRWIRRDGDALACPEGAVLVLHQPLPRFAALLGRAAAVVAEQGGIAGHLATVARELRVPALFAVEQADLLEEGATVTVDADDLAVYAGRAEWLTAGVPSERPSVPDNPVRRALRRAMEVITPLNLLDPDGVSFRAENCRTLHDITRFCHELAVRETFDVVRSDKFPRFASKQLYHNARMHWWLIDLDDGFEGEVQGRYVRLEQIACAPFHALWKGMTLVPWEGPPAVDGRGFASVLFEATANPALESSLAEQRPQGNYFLVARHFMNLQARFGMHFCVVEALAGPRQEENYLAFSFKGGAADDARREARVRLIADLLEERGFAVTLHGDTSNARIDSLPEADVLLRVQLIGYVLMHTRQLDMIMADNRTVEHYRAKMRADLNSMLRRVD